MATGNCTTSRKKRLTAAADGRRLPCARRVLRSRSKANPRIPIGDLGDDLLVGILIRLPNARSVFRCKSVCKRWDSLISDPNFRLHFVSHHRNEGDDDDDREPALLPTDKPEPILSFLPVPDEIRKHFIVVDSFNDMVLCGFRWAKEDESSYHELGRLFFVCNPFTRQWVALPLAPERSDPCLVSTESLVCEPRSNTTHDSNGQVISIDSEYRFRVVHLCGTAQAPKIDVFCSESGEWMTDVIDMDRNLRFVPGRLMSCCNGKLCWLAADMIRVAVWDPFRPHVPPTSICSPCLAGRVGAQVWASHGDLHKIEVYPDVLPGLPWSVLCVFRLTEEGIGTADGKCRELYKASWMDLLRSVREEYGDMELHNVLALHPSKPEIVFLELSSPLAYGRLIFSCNLRTMELKFVADQVPSIRWKVLQPRFTCWPTPISSYEKLRGMYDGTYSCLVQSCSKESPTPLINETERKAVEGVERIGRPRKSSRSTSLSKCPVNKKQNVVKVCCWEDATKRKLQMNGRKSSDDQLSNAVHALQDTPGIDDELFLDACDLFEESRRSAQLFLALDGRMRKKWLLRKLCREESV